nr:hypothetical protein OG461_08635 [Streptomyces sp. NBC_00995]
MELRQGIQPATFATASPDTILAMPLDILFDFAAVHVIGERAAEAHPRIDFRFTDLDETWTMWVARGVLNARRGAHPQTLLTFTGPKAALVGALLKPAVAPGPAQAGKTTLDGDAATRRRDGARDARRSARRVRPRLRRRHPVRTGFTP